MNLYLNQSYTCSYLTVPLCFTNVQYLKRIQFRSANLSIISSTMYHNQLTNAQDSILIYKNAFRSLVYIAVLKILMTVAGLIRFVLLFWF